MTISIRTGKLRRHLTDSSFVSVLNKTKWNRLFEELNQSHLPLSFRRKDLGEAESAEQRWDGDMFHVFGDCEAIEWLDIQAKLPINRGKLLKPEVQDSTSELIAVARKAKLPFSLTPDGIRIWGYIRAGADVQWVPVSNSIHENHDQHSPHAAPRSQGFRRAAAYDADKAD